MAKNKQSFESLVKDKQILKAIQDIGIKTATEIQEKAIPLILEGKNIIAQSATGTGKTIAYLAGILPSITKQNKIQALIIVPTRELANQVYEETKKLAKIKELQACAIFGGASVSNQARQLRKADIVIGTPGRIIDQFERKNLKLNNVKYLVLDEADRMCDMGFFEDISRIIERLPKERQTLLFSATITNDVSNIERKYIPHAQRVSVQTHVDPKNLLQYYYIVKQNQKFALLLHLVKQHSKKAIVFCNTRSEVDVIYNNLKEHRIDCFKLHGGLEQNKRTGTIERYHEDIDGLLISTDVSARGIHIDNLEYIYNYDLPKDNTQYIHRIGRTARAGKKGKAISIVTQKQEEDFLNMCKRFGFLVEEKPLPAIVPITLKRTKEEKEVLEKINRYRERKAHFSKSRKERKKENLKKIVTGKLTEEDIKKKRIDFYKHKKKIKQKKYMKRGRR